jgi:hypothetical protein
MDAVICPMKSQLDTPCELWLRYCETDLLREAAALDFVSDAPAGD